jgi:uncharacterized protein (DUF433 family)
MQLPDLPPRTTEREGASCALKAPFDRITIEAGKMGGQPCIRGMRITVRRVLEILATYPERAELFEEYPDLTEEDLQQALAFAAAAVDGTINLHLDAA